LRLRAGRKFPGHLADLVVGDLAGADGGDPVIVLWAESKPEELTQSTLMKSGAVLRGLHHRPPRFLAAPAQTAERAALGLFAILPLIWRRSICGQRDTATAA